MLAAAADRATATTLVTPEGRSLTEVSLTVRNQAQPFLRVGLPAGRDAALGGSRRRRRSSRRRAPMACASRCCARASGRKGPYAVSFVYLHAGPAFAEKGEATLSLARVDLPVAWLEWEMLLPDRMEASRFDGTAIPRDAASPVAAPDGLALRRRRDRSR